MSASVNSVTIIGNLGQDVDLKTTKGGMSVANMSVATSYKKGEQETTEWHKVVMFDKMAENAAKYVGKGNSVYVQGRIQSRQFEGNDGTTKYFTEIIANDVKFLSFKEDGAKPVTKPAAIKRARAAAVKTDALPDDLLF